MSKSETRDQDLDMRPYYDFSAGVRGKYIQRFAGNSKVVVLEPPVAGQFSSGADPQIAGAGPSEDRWWQCRKGRRGSQSALKQSNRQDPTGVQSEMTEMLAKAVEQAQKLADEQQDAIAAFILEEIEDEARWDAAFARSHDVLEQLAAEAEEEDRQGLTKELDPDSL